MYILKTKWQAFVPKCTHFIFKKVAGALLFIKKKAKDNLRDTMDINQICLVTKHNLRTKTSKPEKTTMISGGKDSNRGPHITPITGVNQAKAIEIKPKEAKEQKQKNTKAR
jgi:hypothetical protein